MIMTSQSWNGGSLHSAEIYTMRRAHRSKCAMLQKLRGNVHFEINIAANLWPFAKLDYSSYVLVRDEEFLVVNQVVGI